MTPERWRAIKSLYLGVCDVEEAQRESLLRARCDGDHDLYRAVCRLLDADQNAPELFERPASESFAPRLGQGGPNPLIGKHIGAYRIVAPIAAGGMGQVFLASRSDEHFHKDVAIKLVRPELVSEDIVHRFNDERNTLARLDHPNIARLLDGGITDDGYPYFIMEYVDGQPIDRYCDRRGLTIDQRLGLFQDVCAAVQFLHQNLIVHRDLKPGNILVTQAGTVKLLDFGIAKVIPEKPFLNGTDPVTRDIRLTPEYASPEQIKGDPISTRSDVYSLGVVLYQLLTGHHPYGTDSRSLFDLERQIWDKGPDRPSTAIGRTVEIAQRNGTPSTYISPQTVSAARRAHPAALQRQLAGDLDAIVLKALQPAPDRRYASAEQLGDDIQRRRTGLPVSARPDTIRYRMGKFVGRRKGIVAASIAAVLALVAGIIGTSWQARIANLQRDAALSAKQHAIDEAERARIEARKSDRVVAFFQSMLGAADPSQAGPDATIGEVVEHAAANVAADYDDDPEVESAIHTAVGQTFRALGRYRESKTHLDRALEIQRDLHEPPHADIAARHRDLAELLYKQREFESAALHASAALEMDQDALGPNTPETARDLNNLAAINRALGNLDQAEKLLGRALALRRAQKDLGAVAATLNNLAGLCISRGDFLTAERYCREALEIRRSEYEPQHPLVAQSIDNLAVTLGYLDRFQEAQALHEESIASMKLRLGTTHPDLFSPLSNVGTVIAKSGKFNEAVPYFEEALAIGASYLEPADPLYVSVRMQLAETLLMAKRYDESEKMLLAIQTLLENQPGTTDAAQARVRKVLALLRSKKDRPEQRDELGAGTGKP